MTECCCFCSFVCLTNVSRQVERTELRRLFIEHEHETRAGAGLDTIDRSELRFLLYRASRLFRLRGLGARLESEVRRRLGCREPLYRIPNSDCFILRLVVFFRLVVFVSFVSRLPSA